MDTNITRKYNQKYINNKVPFYEKNSEEFAYFLGFFYADGYNNETQRKITMSLKVEDVGLLENFSKLFFGNRPVKKYTIKCQTNNFTKICSLSVRSVDLSKLLSEYGAPQSKTFKIRFPYWLSDNLYRHFIRGYFDGDGSIEISNGGKSFKVSISGNEIFNNQLKNVIKLHTQLNFGIIKQRKITILYKGGNRQSLVFLDWLYKDSTIYLDRKFSRYKQLTEKNKNVDNKYQHVFFSKQKNKWVARLPSKYGRKWIGGYLTKEDAINAYNAHPLIINTHRFEKHQTARPNGFWRKSSQLYTIRS